MPMRSMKTHSISCQNLSDDSPVVTICLTAHLTDELGGVPTNVLKVRFSGSISFLLYPQRMAAIRRFC